MNLLLDTHAVLWWLADRDLSPTAKELIADPANLVVVSAASVWEVAIKRSLGKVTAPDGFAAAVEEVGFQSLPVGFAHAERAGALPPHHRDPFDRMLVAQAELEDLTLMTRDPVFAAYGVAAISC